MQRPDIEMVGAIDIDPNLIVRDLGDVVGLDKKMGVRGFDIFDAIC